MTYDIEHLAEAVHQAYLDTCDSIGWSVKPENRVPYSHLSEQSKELDRASVRAVLLGIGVLTAPPLDEPSGAFEVGHCPDHDGRFCYACQQMWQGEGVCMRHHADIAGNPRAMADLPRKDRTHAP